MDRWLCFRLFPKANIRILLFKNDAKSKVINISEHRICIIVNNIKKTRKNLQYIGKRILDTYPKDKRACVNISKVRFFNFKRKSTDSKNCCTVNKLLGLNCKLNDKYLHDF